MAGADEAYLHKLNPAIVTAVIPNGVDPSLFGVADQTRGKTDLIFVGKLADDYLLYLEQFLKDGWPIIHRECPEVRLHIVGKIGDQAQQLRAQAERMDGVIFEGYVELLAEAYSGCGISIVPVNKNCGIINKAIEAMAAGLVVVGFDKTFIGIAEAKLGEHFVTAEDYAGMGRTVVEVIRDEPRRLAIQRNAHQLAAQYYSWINRQGNYENMYLSAQISSLK
jgi:glycosyltransferase involved in cell wall biosynthesis